MSEEAKLLAKSLMERILRGSDGLYRLDGAISPSEYAALSDLIGSVVDGFESTEPLQLPSFTPDLRLLSCEPVTEGLLCVDFGTAASKVGYEPGNDRFEPLAIGQRAGEGDPFWVVSAVTVDADGRMLFGSRAIDAAIRTGEAPLTSFKSRLWQDPNSLNQVAITRSGTNFTLKDCIVAYLAFLTELAKQELQDKRVSPHTPRRYAMPYAYDPQRKAIREALADMVGIAAILSDSLGTDLVSGIDYRLMRSALDSVASLEIPLWLVKEPGCVGEPVAAGSFAMDEVVTQLTVYMIVDIGAGTTDFSILCIKQRADGGTEALQIRNGSLTVEVAGNAVDQALVDFLVRQEAGEEHRAALTAIATQMKERLFSPTAAEDERFDQELQRGLLISVDRREFLASPEWRAFSNALVQAQAKCFDQADRAFLQGYGTGAIRVVLTGGGAALPLAQELASGRSGGEVKVVRQATPDFPLPIRQRFADILGDLPRLATALGGSRRDLPGEFDRTITMATGDTAPVRVYQPIIKTITGLDEN